jgi:hypothetical protein
VKLVSRRPSLTHAAPALPPSSPSRRLRGDLRRLSRPNAVKRPRSFLGQAGGDSGRWSDSLLHDGMAFGVFEYNELQCVMNVSFSPAWFTGDKVLYERPDILPVIVK